MIIHMANWNTFKKHITTLSLFCVSSVAGMHAINKSIGTRSVSKNILKTQTGHFYQWEHGSVYYETAGDEGTPVLLIHDPSPSSSGYDWVNLSGGLSEKNIVYIVDLPGCGRSSKPDMEYTTYFYVRFLIDFMKDVIQERAIVICAGFSATFCLMADLFDNQLIERFVLINPPDIKAASLQPDQRTKAIKNILTLPVIGTTIYYILYNQQNIDYLVNEKLFYNPFKIKKKTEDAIYEAAHLGDGKGRYLLASINGRYINWDIRRALIKTEKPTDILYGSKSGHGEKIALSYTKYHESTKIHEIVNSRRMPHLENPADTLAVLDHIL